MRSFSYHSRPPRVHYLRARQQNATIIADLPPISPCRSPVNTGCQGRPLIHLLIAARCQRVLYAVIYDFALSAARLPPSAFLAQSADRPCYTSSHAVFTPAKCVSHYRQPPFRLSQHAAFIDYGSSTSAHATRSHAHAARGRRARRCICESRRGDIHESPAVKPHFDVVEAT